MADIEFDDDVVTGLAPLNGVALAKIVNGLGALVSLALIAGLGVWGYQLMVRDVTGIPVVRALEGPMREAPLDPGGIDADHQGLAVNNIPAVGEAEAPADRLVLAPKPTRLTAQDQTAAALGALGKPTPPSGAESAIADATENETPALDQAALIEATLRSVESGDDLVAPSGAAQSAVFTATDVIAASVPGVSKSLRPSLRPASPNHAAAAASSPATTNGAAGTAVRSISPADIPVGTRLAQLGAFETEDIAIAQWATISAQFADYMSDKARVIQRAQSGGNVFYRLRVQGFDDLSDARQFCSALLAKQANCIPVVTR